MPLLPFSGSPGLSLSSAQNLFVQKSGDAMSGRLSIITQESLSDSLDVDTSIGIAHHAADSNAGSLTFYKKGTTGNIDSALQNDQTIGGLYLRGFDGNGYNLGGQASFNSTETWSGTGHGTAFKLILTANGNTSQFTALNINQDGAMTLGGSNSTINLNGATAKIQTASNTNLSLVPNGTGYTLIGDASTSSHSFNTNDDLFVSGRLETDGISYFDNQMNVSVFNLTGAQAAISISAFGSSGLNYGALLKVFPGASGQGWAFNGSVWISGSSNVNTGRGVVGTNNINGSGTLSTAVGLYAQNTVQGANIGGITNSYAAYLDSASAGSAGFITNNYGLYIADQTAGGALNYSIYTGLGRVRFGDNLVLGGTPKITTESNENLSIIPNGTGYTIIGTGTTDHSINTPNDFLVSGTLEVNGHTYHDGSVSIDTNLTSASLVVGSTNTSVIFAVSTQLHSSSAGAGIIGYSDSGAALSSGDRAGYFLLGGASDASHTLANTAGMSAFATENWNGASNGTKLVFQTTPNGSTTKVTALTLSQDQSATFGGLIYPQQLSSAPTYVKGAIYFDTTLNKLRVGGASGWETVTSS